MRSMHLWARRPPGLSHRQAAQKTKHVFGALLSRAAHSEPGLEWMACPFFHFFAVQATFGLSKVRCPEEGCPPVETVITDLSVKAPRPGAGQEAETSRLGQSKLEGAS